jgi:hypothetical protein
LKINPNLNPRKGRIKMDTTNKPVGQEREVKFLGGASIDGAPVAYIVVLAAVVTALAFIPFSVVLASGGSFPMSQGIFGLLGWILGPIAGAVASGIGTLIGVFVAPHTAGVWPVSLYGAVITSFAAGIMVLGGKRKSWWIGIAVLSILSFLFFVGRAIFLNAVSVQSAILGSFVDWSAIILFVLPTRTLFAKWIGSKKIGYVAAGLFLGTWMTFGLAHVCQSAVTYFMFNWPEEVWIMLIPLIPFEFISRCAIGAVIGTGVIAGLRAIGLVKPTEAIY